MAPVKRTVFNTPVITPIFRFLARLWLKWAGWKVSAKEVPEPPFVFIAAPHTSNWDFPYLIASTLVLRIEIHWMGKHTLFTPVTGAIMCWLGGIPVNRTKAHNMVSRMAERLKTNPNTILCIPPEGTRSKVKEWKSGFYFIARKAGVPILMAAIDSERRELKLMGEFIPSGDLDKDLRLIKSHYQGIKGINPENF